jgi:hypothetical protein
MILMGSITSCGLSGKRKHSGGTQWQSADEAKGLGEVRAPPMRTIGEIVSVHPDEKFVLVKRFLQAGAFGSELIASVSPEGTTSSLSLTGEKLGRFYAADIQEGKPSRGDLVVIRRTDGKGPPNGRSEPSSKMEDITE